MDAAGLKTKSDILFVGTVGEEGLGDLRGVRYLFTKGKYKDRIKAFFSLDGGGVTEFATGGVGSKRYRVTFKGPGGHSYGAFGLVNPMAAMAQAVVELYKTNVPTKPEDDLQRQRDRRRHLGERHPARGLDGVRHALGRARRSWPRSRSASSTSSPSAVETENDARSTKEGPITFEAKLVGDRPAGQTDAKADIVQFATAAFAAHGLKPEYRTGSTDSNMPMSLGIPAITMPRADKGGRAHALDEWVDTEKESNLMVKKTGLTTILAVAGLE